MWLIERNNNEQEVPDKLHLVNQCQWTKLDRILNICPEYWDEYEKYTLQKNEKEFWKKQITFSKNENILKELRKYELLVNVGPSSVKLEVQNKCDSCQNKSCKKRFCTEIHSLKHISKEIHSREFELLAGILINDLAQESPIDLGNAWQIKVI